MEKEFFRINVNKYDADKDFVLTRASSLNNPHNHSVMFCTKSHLFEAENLKKVNECLVFWPQGEGIPAWLSQRHVVITAEYPRQAYAMFFSDNDIVYYPQPCEYVLTDGAFIAKGAVVGDNTTIFPGVYIGEEVAIGNGCYIGSGVKLTGKIKIGNNVVIRENAVIGVDGLSFARKSDGSAATIPQFGGVIIEDNVQIGANTVIARGAIDDTVIHKGCKIDNCSFVSHNVQIGAHTFIVSETNLFGGVKVGEKVHISGNVTVREKVQIGNEAYVGIGSVVISDVPEGAACFGNPARVIRK